MKLVNYCLILVVVLFTACGSSKQMPVVKIPSWFLTGKAHTSQNFYGTGSADTIEEAKNIALASISSSLSVSIKSQTNISKTTSANSYNKEVEQNINASTKKLQFTNAKVLKAEQAGYDFYVLVEVNKLKLFNENKNILLNNDAYIEEQVTLSSTQSLLEQINIYSSMKNKLIEGTNNSYMLYAIHNGFDYKSYVSKYSTYLNKSELLKNKIIIDVSVGKTTGSKYFKDELINFLNENKYKVSSSNNNVKIILQPITNFSKYNSWKIAKTTTSVTVSSKTKIISNTVIKSTGRSSSSQENAIVSSSSSFKKALQKNGIESLLFAK